jgi:hypothetical protein
LSRAQLGPVAYVTDEATYVIWPIPSPAKHRGR